MGSFPPNFLVHTVSVETCAGRGAAGETFLSAKSISCFVDDGLVVATGGATIAVSDSTTIYAPLAYAPSSPPVKGQFAVNSRVTVNGQVTRVIKVKRRSSGPLGLPDHVEVTVQ